MPYELVWEDNQFLSGKSFYLPGSVDANNKQMDQWNVMAPPLYLWSRSDFSAQHKSIAAKHGHLPREPESSNQEINIDETHISEQPLKNVGHHNDASELKDHMQNHKIEEEECRQEASATVTPKVCSPHQQFERKGQDNHGHVKNQSKKIPWRRKKKKRCEENHGRGTDEKSPIDGQSGGRIPIREMYSGIPHSSPSNVMGGRSSVEGISSKSSRLAALTGIGENVNQHLNPTMSCSQVKLGTSYGDTTTSIADDMGRRYSINTNDPYSVGAHNFHYGPYTNEVGRESNIQSQVRLHRQDPDVYTQRSYLAGLDSVYGQTRSLSTPSYKQHLGATVDPSYRMNTSTMQRYAPRLDELNHTRIGTPGPEPPMGNRNAFFDPRAPRPPHSMGFAPGPYHPYSHQNSAGWLNE